MSLIKLTGAYWEPEDKSYRIIAEMNEYGGQIRIEQGGDKIVLSPEEVITIKTLLESAKEFVLEND